jgi:hypothetical protein
MTVFIVLPLLARIVERGDMSAKADTCIVLDVLRGGLGGVERHAYDSLSTAKTSIFRHGGP